MVKKLLKNSFVNRYLNLDKNLYRPYNALIEEFGEDAVREEFIKDHEGKVVYSVVEPKC